MIHSIYDWIMPWSEFINKQPDTLKQVAIDFKMQFQTGSCLIAFLILLLTTSVICWGYYKPYNNMAGRHYKWKYWSFFLVANFLSVALLTNLSSYFVDSTLTDQGTFFTRLIFLNAFYSIPCFVLLSIIVCNTSIKTNAYKFLKF